MTTRCTHIKREFGGPTGSQLISRGQTQLLHVFRLLSSTADGSFDDLAAVMSSNTDHRQVTTTSSHDWIDVWSKIAAHCPASTPGWFQRKMKSCFFKFTAPLRGYDHADFLVGVSQSVDIPLLLCEEVHIQPRPAATFDECGKCKLGGALAPVAADGSQSS